ncbi:GerAB/ArcD/ProY family transporter [Virgibacillus ndiopensis]|uniref:GerAB/ArcD/ProY family transporter n=1 Tax=Virgibacillus ndiopensis TaxID=2004408 RepID=UPI000C06D7DD|nr:GerAB/ArcD/ProY family transporter [Virgibacillus ndiopensis]
MDKQVKESLTVSPFFIFFLIHGTQTGVGMLSFQNEIIKNAEQDAWVSVLLVGFSFHLIIWMIYFLLKRSTKGDIFSLHQQLFGNWFGSILNIFLYVYMILITSSVIRSYVETLHVWAFPYIEIWELSLIVLLATTYIVFGGFRVVTGICFWGVVIPSLLLFTLYYLFPYAQWDNLKPYLNHSWNDYFNSSKNIIYMYLGVGFLLIYFPFIKDNVNSKKWAHISQFYTTFIYFILTVTSLVFFSLGQLEHITWPTLNFSKIIYLPFIERFEFVYIFTWLFVILPPCCVALWSGTRILRKTINLKAKYSLWISSSIIYLVVINFKSQIEVETLNRVVSLAGSIFLFCYIPVLFIWLNIYNILFKRKRYKH